MKRNGIELAKVLHKMWMNERDAHRKEMIWGWFWDELKDIFHSDFHKMMYISDLILVKHLDEMFGGSHFKEICKDHCRDFRKERI